MENERERERNKDCGAGNPNEYLISAYLTPPDKVQSDGMAGSLPGG